MPDTTKGEVLTPQTCPQLFSFLEALENTQMMPDQRAYYFVIDTSGNMIVNGGSPEIAKKTRFARPGTNVFDYTDTDDNKAVQQILSKAASGGGYVEYKWPCPQTKQVCKKVSYVRAIPNSKWVIGSGLYV